MTSPAEPASGDAAQASQLIKPLRELAALVLLGANAVLLFVGLLRLLVPVDDYSTFSGRAGSTYFSFVGLEATVLPLLAVLIATVILPVVPKAKLITQVALVEYAVSAVFGALTFLIWLVGRLADGEVLDAFLGLLTRAAWLAIFAVAAFVVFKIWRTLYYVPKPKAQPGVYGQPQPGWPQQGQPGGYPGPGGYPQQQQPGQGYPQAGSPPPGWPQQPGPYGQPQSAPPFNTAPPHAPQSGPPFADQQSAPQPGSPYAGPQQAPQYGSPQSAPPFGQPPSADPTQAIPRQSAEPGAPSPAADDERTQRFDREDPNQPR
ncbi:MULTISPECIES: hypothetical protein [unclassified Micromonospora]|uniref:hypothetical protein n=1 Tax=unclassified Micromonospora TaxID=2617518 RepID=UPI001B383C7E|nr:MULTISPECIES: hypothetical protein [unclassified Micromonospora]MBQ1044685.1 hypothetical protein [Micromonospora sp. C72]MBQ1055622.1 hypothetical protein [Micromonospora sp. C32]